MLNKETRNQIAIALSDYVVNSSDVYDRIYKINDENTYVEVSNILKNFILIENLEDEVKDVWHSMKKEAFVW